MQSMQKNVPWFPSHIQKPVHGIQSAKMRNKRTGSGTQVTESIREK